MNQQDKDRLRELASNVSDRSKATQAGDMDFHRAANPAAILYLLEENEALARDAARWRFIRRRLPNAHYITARVSFGEDGEPVDAAIDAAMQPKGD